MKHLTIILLLLSFNINLIAQLIAIKVQKPIKTLKSYRKSNLDLLQETTFRFPCGDSIGTGYYIAQGFQDENFNGGSHLGIDINGINGGDSDLGDTIYSIGNGIVANKVWLTDYLAIYYKYDNNIIKAVYYHCLKMFPQVGQYIKKGEPIALIGNSGGLIQAHLHLEIVSDTSIFARFYGDTIGFINPLMILPHK